MAQIKSEVMPAPGDPEYDLTCKLLQQHFCCFRETHGCSVSAVLRDGTGPTCPRSSCLALCPNES